MTRKSKNQNVDLEKLARLNPTQAKEALWRKGVLVWKLNTAQKKIYEVINDKSNEFKIPVFSLSRRIGKTWTLLVIAIEKAIQNPGITIHYVCPTAEMAKKILRDNVRQILEDCPTNLKPKYYKHDRMWEFPNGSKIQIEGADSGNAERLRGTATTLGIVDEAGFVSDLEYVVKDILLPQTLSTNGKIVLCSTPPKSLDHAFTDFLREAKKRESFVHLGIYDVLDMIKEDPEHLRKHLNTDIIEELKKTTGADTVTWRREYLAELITDTTFAVIPEFNTELKKKLVTDDYKIPSKYDAYVSMDPGFTDCTGILFAFYDFERARVVIQDEFLGKGSEITSDHIASVLKNKEVELWFDPDLGKVNTYMRISDNEPLLLNDLNRLHNLLFIPARKYDKESAINELRVKLSQEKIVINPKCVNLIHQIETATWNKHRTSFVRSKDGHFDLIDALIYLIRMIHWNKNPFTTQHYDEAKFFNPNKKQVNYSPTANAFRKAILRKK